MATIFQKVSMTKWLDIIITAFAFWSLIGVIFLAGVALQSIQQEDVTIAKKHGEKIIARNV
jgi:hypothetical protein